MTMLEIFRDMLSTLPVDLKIIKAREFNAKWKLTLEFKKVQTTV